MRGYIIKRLLSLIPVLLVVSIVIFMIIHITPGDPARIILGPEASTDAINNLREEMGLNEPIIVQYFSWLGSVLTGDLGTSHFMNQPVLTAFLSHLRPTISLALMAQIIAIIIAIPAGILAARRKNTITDQTFMTFSFLGMAVPNFLLALFLVLILAVNLQLLPVAGYRPLSMGLWEHIKHLIMPAIALGTAQAALLARMTRTSMIDSLSQDFIKTAISKGLKSNKVIYKHAFKNALIPIITIIGQTFGSLIAGAVITEVIFNIPGIGQLIINSVERRDFPVIQGGILLITVTYVFINLVVDLLYGVIDPRVRLNK